jgi:multiple sugar transport system substrate-binding protein
MPASPLRRRRVLALAVATALGLTTAACSDDSSSSGTADKAASGPVTLGFVGPELAATFTPVIAAFEKANPTIKIKYTSVPFDQLNSTLQARLGSKDKSIDVYTADQSRIPSLAARGFLTDLSEFKAQADQNNLPTQVEASSYQGKLFSLPIWTSSQFLFYNKDLLSKAGVTPPSADAAQRWTWEQVTDAAKKAQAAGAQYGLLFDQVDRYYQLQVLAESAGGGSGLTGEDLLKPDLNNPGWTKAMQWYGQIHADKVSPRGIGPDQMNPLFSAGKSAFFVGGPWAITAMKGNKKLNWGVAPHPYFAGGNPVTPTDSWSWGINPASANQEAAKKFLQFVSLTREGSLESIKSVFIIPANKQAFDEYQTQLDASDPPSTTGASKLMAYELENTAVHRPRSVGYVQFEDIMLKVLGDVRNGADPAKRLSDANSQIEQAFARLK